MLGEKTYVTFSRKEVRERRKCHITPQKMKFSINDFFSKCDQIRRILRIWPHLLKKSLIENSIFCAMTLLRDIMDLRVAPKIYYFSVSQSLE